MINDEFDFTDALTLRKKAEEKLLDQEQSNAGLTMEADLKKLLHELQVHQIELQMQNEELVKAYETAGVILKKYTLIYDLAPVGLFILDVDGSICDLNFTAANILGQQRFRLLESNFKLFVAEDSLAQFNHFLDQVYSCGTKLSCGLNLAYDDKTIGQVYMEGVVTGDAQKCLISVIDFSLLKNNI